MIGTSFWTTAASINRPFMLNDGNAVELKKQVNELCERLGWDRP